MKPDRTDRGAAETPGEPLDVAVRAALRSAARQLDAPRTLFLLGTGEGLLADRLVRPRGARFGELDGAPAGWRAARLSSGELAGHPVWLCEDRLGEPSDAARPAPPWQRAFPVWLAAAAGAVLLVHTSAGAALSEDGPLDVGAIAVLSDHLNLSGSTPLAGLGESTLGPLFPDLSRLHHAGLRRAALRRARALGLKAAEAVAACTAGPSTETPAERRFLARTGAGVSVQGLAAPLLAAAHAGLSVLALVVVAERGPGPARLREIVAAAGAAEAALEDLCAALAPDLAAAAAEAEERA